MLAANKLVYYRDFDMEMHIVLVSETELIKMVDESDFTNIEIIKIYDVKKPGAIYELKYVGWQPNCLIEFKDKQGNVRLRGYGTNH